MCICRHSGLGVCVRLINAKLLTAFFGKEALFSFFHSSHSNCKALLTLQHDNMGIKSRLDISAHLTSQEEEEEEEENFFDVESALWCTNVTLNSPLRLTLSINFFSSSSLTEKRKGREEPDLGFEMKKGYFRVTFTLNTRSNTFFCLLSAVHKR